MKNRVTKHILSILLCFVMLVGLMPTAVLAAGEIDKVELTLDVPIIGNTLDFEPTAGAGNYEITSVRWLKDWGEHGNMLCDVYHKVQPGEPYTVRICINPKEGYSFADLDDLTVTVNGSTEGVTFTHYDLYTGIICSVAFEELGYSVSFDANGGTGTMEEVTNVYPDYTLPECGFTAPEGKVFNGWTVGSASGAWYAAGSTMDINADVTLYAKWADPSGSHKITFVNPAYDPNPTAEIIVSEGMYTLPGIEGIFEIPSGSTFEEWEVSIDERWQYFAPGEQISVTEDLEINAIWKPIEYERISKAVFEVKLNPGVEYKHGMLAGSLSVSLGEVSGTFNEGAPKPLSLASGGYGHGYWIVSDDMLLGTDALSTRGGYRLYVKFDIPDDRHVRLHPDGFSLSGDLGNITARSIVSLDGALVALFNLPAVPGTELGTENITFTLNGYEAGETITAITAGVDTPHVSLRGSGYGSRLDDKSYMIWKDYYDYGYGVYDGSSKFENSRFYYLEINYALGEGYSFPANFWDGDELIKEKFKLSGFEKVEVYQVDRNSIVFRLPQMGNTVIESVAFILNGYEEGKAAGNVTVTILDKMIFPREDLDYFFYDESVGFSPEGAMSPIPATTFENGKRYYIAMLIGATDGYDASELEKGDFTIHTPYGSCTATGYGRATAFIYNEYYYVGFELPVINNASFTTYTVSFDADGGTGTMSDVTGVFGEYTLPVCGFTAPSDKRFKAWSVRGVEKAVGEKITITADTTITAIWEDIPVTTYALWVGGTQVTESNKGDILGDGKTKYDPDTKTLTLTGTTLTNVYNDALIYVEDMELIINAPSGLTLDNTANEGPAIYADGSYDLTVNGNVDLKADKAPAIVCGKNLTINGNAKVYSANSAVLTASGSVTINGNATINSGSSAPGISAGADIVLNGSTHEVNSSLLGSAAVTITGDFKSTVTGNSPAINGKVVSITGKVDITSGNSLGIAASNKVSIKGDTKIEAKQMAISVNAGSVVLEGTKHKLTSTEAPGIYCSGDITIKGAVIVTAGPHAINSTGGTVTIDGDVTATSTAAPAITAKTIEVKSGTWTLSGNPMAMYAECIVISDTHEIVKPEGAKLNDEKTCIVEADGTTNVSGATIAPKAGATKTPIDTINIEGITAPASGEAAVISGITTDTAGITLKTVQWNKSGGVIMNSSDKFEVGETYTLYISYEAQSGYEISNTVTVTSDLANSTIITATSSYVSMQYTVPEPAKYTVTFDANGGTGTMTAVSGIYGEYTLPACGFTAPYDKQFKAWSVGGAEKAVGATINVTANTTVTAIWDNIPVTYYTVIFDSVGGSAVTAQTVTAGQKVTKPADPVKNDYIFKGWTLDGSAYDFNTAVNRNITLVAVWEEDNSFMDDWYWALIMLHSQRFDITATASEGGEIAPAGVTRVQYSKNITYTITPDVGYAIKSVIVDGKDVGAVSEYTFNNVTNKHTIHAVFEKVNPYTDVKADDWFYEDVLYVTAMDLMEGTGEGKFSPEITTDRAMLVTVLWRLEGCPVVDSPVDFFDVADGLWYSEAIDWASANGIVYGYGDGRFGPANQITREQIMAILNRYAAYKGWMDGIVLSTLAQYKCSDWAESNVIWAENYGLLDGLGVDVSDMTAKASRAELAAYLHRFMKNIVK